MLNFVLSTLSKVSEYWYKMFSCLVFVDTKFPTNGIQTPFVAQSLYKSCRQIFEVFAITLNDMMDDVMECRSGLYYDLLFILVICLNLLNLPKSQNKMRTFDRKW